jgi:hypothetical protein
MATTAATAQPDGSAKLAKLMSNGVIPIFKRFAELNIHSLIRLQADLMNLHLEFDGISEAKRLATAAGSTTLNTLVEEEEKILDRIRLKLESYSKCKCIYTSFDRYVNHRPR